MTRNHRLKTQVRAQQAAAGVPYSVARRRVTSALAEVMQEHPLLSNFGIGVFDAHRKTTEQRRDELEEGRAILAGREAVIFDTVAWLRDNVTPIKTPAVSSYGMKHVMERTIGVYTTNGEFIAAALIAGYSFKYARPNVLFGMSARDVSRLRVAAH
ncbi:hypothetical protein [Kineosporia sp. A_224]|uniref:hypothetical protein n=1 Tax=Kineosporia sp. A_224 TaxID=1962180 RepID=UPI000B4B2CE3|nr:hypothetical protein [Kineosporia sp. A_224]